MKKVILLILLLTVVTSTFSACGDTPATESSSESATSKVVAITTTSEKDSETSYVATETESAVETTPAVSETQSKTETNPEPVSEKKLNLDLLSDIGLTYGQIKEKYGNVSDSRYNEGSHCFIFERSEAYYWFEYTHYLGINEGDIPRDDEKSIAIDYVYAKNIFLGLESTLSASEIETFYNLNYLGTFFRYESRILFIIHK